MFEWGCLVRRVIEGIEEGRNKITCNLQIFSLSKPCTRFTVVIPADTIHSQAQSECLTLGEMSSLHLEMCPISTAWSS